MSLKKHPFLFGFLGALLLFLILNLLIIQLRSDCGLPGLLNPSTCADAIQRIGFPLQFYETGGLIYRNNFNPFNLFLNLLISFTLSTAAGLILKKQTLRPKT